MLSSYYRFLSNRINLQTNFSTPPPFWQGGCQIFNHAMALKLQQMLTVQ